MDKFCDRRSVSRCTTTDWWCGTFVLLESVRIEDVLDVVPVPPTIKRTARMQRARRRTPQCWGRVARSRGLAPHLHVLDNGSMTFAGITVFALRGKG